MRRIYLLFIIFSLLFSPAGAQVHIVTIENPTGLHRSELVAVSADQLGIAKGTDVVVRDAFGIERTSQWTYDGKLLLDVHVRPNGSCVSTDSCSHANTPSTKNLICSCRHSWPISLNDNRLWSDDKPLE